MSFSDKLKSLVDNFFLPHRARKGARRVGDPCMMPMFFFYSEKEIVLGVNLNEAAEKGLLHTVEFLVGEGASVDEKDEYGLYFNRTNSLFVLC